jgi:hypothetical protein
MSFRIQWSGPASKGEDSSATSTYPQERSMSKQGTSHLSERVAIASCFGRQGQGAINLALAIALLASVASIAWHHSALAHRSHRMRTSWSFAFLAG